MISVAVCIYFIITILGFAMGVNLERKAMPFEDALETSFSQSISEVAFDSEEDKAAFDALMADTDPDNTVEGHFAELAASVLPNTGTEEDGSSSRAAAFIAKAAGVLYDENGQPLYSEAVTKAVEENVIPTLAETLESYSDVSGYENALSISNMLFWILATLVGTVQGGIQALSRSYFGQIIPPERSNEYFGFMDIFGKFSCVIGPAMYSLVYSMTGRASLGILSIILLFFAGAVTLLIGRKYFKEPVNAPAEAIEATE
ncbi:MAG: MFS transporter [Ruminococcaceae bacterium]|nr:MFS transporter [Oscillospiraceae bacterium]